MDFCMFKSCGTLPVNIKRQPIAESEIFQIVNVLCVHRQCFVKFKIKFIYHYFILHIRFENTRSMYTLFLFYRKSKLFFVICNVESKLFPSNSTVLLRRHFHILQVFCWLVIVKSFFVIELHIFSSMSSEFLQLALMEDAISSPSYNSGIFGYQKRTLFNSNLPLF